ncbi:MAG: SRPBCC family protein [Taibaiella sp.]|nr:SRPBCC family protein [Taibaiella sp.]
MEYRLHKELTIDASIDEVWKFFSSPYNLQKITPAYMNFQITDCPDKNRIFEGMQIAYKVSPVLNVPMKWVTLIQAVHEGVSFTDTQLKGPYKLWKHVHTFEVKPNGVHMSDDVTYELPMGPLGELAHSLFVKKQLEEIFDYRETAVRKIFKTNGNDSN